MVKAVRGLPFYVPFPCAKWVNKTRNVNYVDQLCRNHRRCVCMMGFMGANTPDRSQCGLVFFGGFLGEMDANVNESTPL